MSGNPTRTLTASKLDNRGLNTPTVTTNLLQLGAHVASGVCTAATLSPTGDMLVAQSALESFEKRILSGTLGSSSGLGSTSQALISPPITDPYFLEKEAWEMAKWDLYNNEAIFSGSSSSNNYLRFKNSVFRQEGTHVFYIHVSQLNTGSVKVIDSNSNVVSTLSSVGVHIVEVDVNDLALDSYYLRAEGVYPEDKIIIGAFAICYVYDRFKYYLDQKVVDIIMQSDDIKSIIPPAPLATSEEPGIVMPGPTLKLTGNKAALDVNPDYLPSASEDERGLVQVGDGLEVGPTGVLSVTKESLESIGAVTPERATEDELGLVRVINPIEPARPMVSPAGYGGAGEVLGNIYDDIDLTMRTGNFMVGITILGTKPFEDIDFVLKTYRNQDGSIRYQIAINPYNGEKLERFYTNLTWTTWGAYGENGLTSHNRDPNAHPELREIFIEVMITKATEIVSSHNGLDTAHADIRALIDAIPQLIRDYVGTHNLDPTAHQDIRDFVISHVTEEIAKIDQHSLPAHNLDPEAHQDIRLDIDDSIVEHNSDEASHPDIRKLIADEVAILHEKIRVLEETVVPPTVDPSTYGEAMVLCGGVAPTEWPEDKVGHHGVLLVTNDTCDTTDPEVPDDNTIVSDADSSCIILDEKPSEWPEDLEDDGLLVVTEE